MSVKQELQTVKKMIDAGMYEEARSILTTIDHPVAKKWLAKINQISPPRPHDDDEDDEFLALDYSAASDDPMGKSKKKAAPPQKRSATMIVVVAFLAVIGALLVGGFLLLSDNSALAGGYEPPIVGDDTSCGAQAWVNKVDGSFNEIYRYNLWEMLFYESWESVGLSVDEDLRKKQIETLRNNLARIEAEEFPDCVANARNDLIQAYEILIEATEIFDQNDPIYAFGRFGKTLDLMVSAGTELTQLGARFRRVDGAAIASVTNVDCPAYAYVTRTMYVDNQFMVMMFVDPGIATLEQYQSFVLDLGQQYYRVKDANVPPCLWEVRNAFVQIIDSMRSMFQAGLGMDIAGIELHEQNLDIAVDKFYEEVAKVGLDPFQFGEVVIVHED